MSPSKKSGGKKHSSNRHTNGVLEYLQSSLPRKALQELYMDGGQFVCRAVLQQISSVGQQIVMRLHCTGGSFPLDGIQVWTSLSNTYLDIILKELHGWAIIQDIHSKKSKNSTSNNNEGDGKANKESSNMVSLTIPFAKGLKDSLSSLDASPWTPLTTEQLQMIEDKERLKPVTPEDLERYTQKQWDAVLHFLVGTVGHKEPPPAMVHFLLQTGLMQPDPDHKGSNKDDAPLVITESGYDFMLQDNHEQVWHFVVQYLRSIEGHERGEELRKEALLLLISLSFAQVGCAYAASSLNKNCRTMVKDLSHFGLLYTRKINKSTIFYPTSVAVGLVGRTDNNSDNNTSSNKSSVSALFSLSTKALETSLSEPNPRGSSHLAIIVQTNFQLCAYTTSELHVSMLGLFCDVGTIRRLPNVVFMHITRDSIKSAFNLGIKARQILRFLEKHAHPKLRNPQTNPSFESTTVPGNVVDQIWLWDREMRRVQFTKVYQHQCMMGNEEFKAVQQYARDKGALSWCSDRKQQLLIDYTYVERIQAFVRQWRAQVVSRGT